MLFVIVFLDVAEVNDGVLQFLESIINFGCLTECLQSYRGQNMKHFIALMSEAEGLACEAVYISVTMFLT